MLFTLLLLLPLKYAFNVDIIIVTVIIVIIKSIAISIRTPGCGHIWIIDDKALAPHKYNT